MVDVVGNSFPVVLNVEALERKRKVGFSELLLFQRDEQRVLKTPSSSLEVISKTNFNTQKD